MHILETSWSRLLAVAALSAVLSCAQDPSDDVAADGISPASDAEGDVAVDQGEDTGPACAQSDCDDSNPCTVDECGADGCSNTPTESACDDGDPCTIDDACQDGACAGTAACWSRWGMFPRSSSRRPSTTVRSLNFEQPDSSNEVSGEPGAVH